VRGIPERRPRTRVGARKLLGAGVVMGGWWDFFVVRVDGGISRRWGGTEGGG